MGSNATIELRPARPAGGDPGLWRGHGFGVVIETTKPFPGLQAPDDPFPPRLVSWRETSAAEIEGAWPIGEGRVLHERRHPDDRLFLRVEFHEDHGFRVWAPYYGRHLVAGDGASIVSGLPSAPVARWQRLFFAEILPLAATLQGLHLLLASAIAVDGRAVAFVGPWNSGKTAVTAHLVGLGADFVSDDVLAVELTPVGALAHPGPARLSLEPSELGRIPLAERARIGECTGRSGELILCPAPVRAALPLGGVYLLRPGTRAEQVAIRTADFPLRVFRETAAVDYVPADALATTALAETVPVYEVFVPRRCRARDVALHVLAHCEEQSAASSI